MIRTDPWQTQALEDLQTMLQAREEVIALAIFGSAASNASVDLWSDLDCVLVIEENSYSQFYPATDWLKAFGEIFACEQFESALHGTTRICFADFRRLDLLITTPGRLRQAAEWPRIPFWSDLYILFSRSVQVTETLNQSWSAPEPVFPSKATFDEMVNRFWFKAMLAGYKIVRDDQLIALHLALDLVRDCCVLGMMLRDRAEGTNIHRTGGAGNQIVSDLNNTGSAYSPAGILDMIQQSAIHFDGLAREWYPDYQERHSLLVEWLEQIRFALKT